MQDELGTAGRSVDGAWVSTGGAAWSSGQKLVVLVHGAGMDHSVWALQARALARNGWNVAAIDLPGHGKSAEDGDCTSIPAYARWLESLLRQLQQLCRAPELQLVGHSMGANVALEVAALADSSVQRLALLGVGLRMPVHPDLLSDTLAAPARAHRFIAAFGHARNSQLGSRSPGLSNVGSTLALLARTPPAVLHRDFAACNDWDGTTAAAALPQPTLVLAGERDRMTPARAGRKLADAIAHADFEVLADAGHMLMTEAPRRVTAALRRFLS